jgi:hypothetical protein
LPVRKISFTTYTDSASVTSNRDVSGKGNKGGSDRPGIVFSKSSTGGHAALVDLTVLERYTRVDGGKKENKVGKIIARLFPAQIEIHPPKESAHVCSFSCVAQPFSCQFGRNL